MGNSIFDLKDINSPLGNWMQSRNLEVVAEREKRLLTDDNASKKLKFDKVKIYLYLKEENKNLLSEKNYKNEENNYPVSDRDLHQIARYATEVYRYNGIFWVDFIFITEKDIKLDLLDGIVEMVLSGSNRTEYFSKSIVNIHDSKNMTTFSLLSAVENGYTVAHEVMHQFMIKLGYLLFGSLFFFHPDGYADPHYNTDENGKEYPNLLMSGKISEQYGFSNKKIWKIHPTMLFFLKNYTSYFDLSNKQYLLYLESNIQPSGKKTEQPERDSNILNPFFNAVGNSSNYRYTVYYMRVGQIILNKTYVVGKTEVEILDEPTKRMSKQINAEYEFS